MRPPKREDREFERVKTDDFVTGYIDNIQYDMEHQFKYQGNVSTAPAIRFVFKIDGCQYNHYSRWMKFNTGERANLYKKYISELVADAKPDMDFDLDLLKGMKIKMLWKEKNGFQWPETIRAINGKAIIENKVIDPESPVPVTEDELEPDEEVPF